MPKNFNFRLLIFFIIFISKPAITKAQVYKTDKNLSLKLQGLIADFHGEVGIYVRNLKTNKTVTINADSLFPTASMIKVPITIGLFDKINKGELNYHAQLEYKDSLLYESEDILGSFKDGQKIALSKVAMLMITTSDNTASLWCQQLATGLAINTWLEANGFNKTRVNSRTQGREKDRLKYGWGQTSPREMAELLVKIKEGKVIDKAASERIYRNLSHIYWDGEALSQLPPTVQTASKQGAINKSRSEVVLVNASSGDYVFCVITKNQKDESWEQNNEGYVLLRNVSRLLYQYFEPKSKWKAEENMGKWN
jgi:beta-lactamase class A